MAGNQPNHEIAAESAPKARAGSGKILVALFMGAVVGGECLIAYLFFPSPEEVAALAEKNLQKALPANLSEHGDAGSEKHEGNVVEVDLGEYRTTVPSASGGPSLVVDFHLWGTVEATHEGEEAKEGGEGEEGKGGEKSVIDRSINRFREQVLFEIRNSAPSDLTDPGLALIKRRILEKSSALFGKPVLKSVFFSNFSCFEQ